MHIWFSIPFTPTRWITTARACIHPAPAKELAGLLSENRIPDSRIADLRQIIKQAVPAVNDKAVLESSVLIVRRIVHQLEVLRESIAEHDKSISKLAQSHPDYAIFSSLPGAGPAMAPG